MTTNYFDYNALFAAQQDDGSDAFVEPTATPQSLNNEPKKENYTMTIAQQTALALSEQFFGSNKVVIPTDNSGIVRYNPCAKGGAYSVFLSPIAIARMEKDGVKAPVASYTNDTPTGDHALNSARKVVLDFCAGDLTKDGGFLSPDLHLYPRTAEGMDQERAGYVRVKDGVVGNMGPFHLTFAQPGRVQVHEDGTSTVCYSARDLGTKSGWLTLHRNMISDIELEAGEMKVLWSHSETFREIIDPKTGAKATYDVRCNDGIVRTYAKTTKTYKAEHNNVVRRHEIIRQIALGCAIEINDAFNHASSVLENDKGLGDMQVFLKRVAWSSISLHNTKNEISAAWDLIKKGNSAFKNTLTQVELTNVPATGELIDIVLERVVDTKRNPVTVSQFAAAGRFWLVRGSIKENGDGRPVNTANVNNWIQVLKDNPTISFVING